MKPILVTDLNNREIAKQIVSLLKSKEFGIVSLFLDDTGKLVATKSLKNMQLLNQDPGGFTIKDGFTKISLNPSRSILWDLSCETVSVEFNENGTINLERILPDNKKVIRIILA